MPVQLLAHRGYAARYPENTREAIGAAVALGATLVEFDVQLSSDHVPYLLHDEDFQRTGDVSAAIFDLPSSEVDLLDVGEPTRFGDTFLGVRPPRLADIARDLKEWPQVTAFVELKRHSIDRFGLAAVLDAVVPILQPVMAQCVFISFRADAVAAARERTGARVGWALRAWDEASRERAQVLRPDFLFCNVTRLPPAPAPLWPGDWSWVVYEIVDPAQALMLLGRGATVIETMAYAELAAGLAAENNA